MLLAICAAGLTAARPAAADPQLQFVGETSLGWTDNVSSSPDEPIPDVPEKKAGTFAVLSPGVVLAAGSPRFMHRLSYTHSLSLFFTESGGNSLSNRLDYRGFYDVSPRTEMVLTSAVVQTSAHTAGVIIAPGASELAAGLNGTGTFVIGTVDEYLSYDLGPGWRWYEGAGVLGATPVLGAEAPQTAEASARTGIEYYIVADSFGLEAGGRYTVIWDGVLADGTEVGTQRQLIGTGLGRWRHDWGYYFTSATEVGVMRVQRLNTGQGFWHPVGGASLAYAVEDGEAELSYSHRVTTSPLIGQSLLVDEVRLRGAIPLAERGEVVVASSAGYQRGRLIEPDATLAARVDVILADVALGWQASDHWLVGPRYTYAQQISDADAPPLPLSFRRHTVMLGATYKLPPDREMPRIYRSPRRVDRADEIREMGGPDRDRTRPPGGGGP